MSDKRFNNAPHTHSERGENVGTKRDKPKRLGPLKPVTPVKSLYQRGVIWNAT